MDDRDRSDSRQQEKKEKQKIRERIAGFLNPKEMRLTAEFCHRENMKSLWFLFNSSLFLCVLTIFLQAVFGRSGSFEPAILLLVVVVLSYLPFILKHDDPAYHVMIAIYSMCLLIGGTAILGDTLFNTGEYAFTGLFYLFLIPQLINDVPWRIIALDGSLAVLYIAVGCSRKESTVLEMDIIRVIIVTAVSLSLAVRKIHRTLHMLNLNTNIQAVAEHDPLTGAYNRAGGEMLITTNVSARRSGTFLIMDIDNFKRVNDSYGHQMGDRALQSVASVLMTCFRASDIVMRLGGDEFVAYLTGMVDEATIRRKMTEVCSQMHTIILDEQSGDHVSISMGVVVNNGSYPDYDTLYKTADHMLYEAKQAGKDGYRMLNVSYKAEKDMHQAKDQPAENSPQDPAE